MAAASGAVRQKIAELYPGLLPLLSDPQVGALLIKAVGPTPYSPGRFEAELHKTRWWRTHSEAQRRWFLLRGVDPKEYAVQRDIMQGDIMREANRLGIKFSGKSVAYLANMALQLGLSADNPAMIQKMVAYSNQPGMIGPGALATNARDMQLWANREYFRALPQHVVGKWARWIGEGTKTMEDFQAQVSAEEQRKYPHFADLMSQGASLADIINPLRETIAQELELQSPEQVSLKDPYWKDLLGVRDPKTNKMRLMTTSEAQRKARLRPEWWNTSGGRQADASMAQTLLQVFGRRA